MQQSIDDLLHNFVADAQALRTQLRETNGIIHGNAAVALAQQKTHLVHELDIVLQEGQGAERLLEHLQVTEDYAMEEVARTGAQVDLPARI